MVFRLQKSSAFSLIELLTVIALIAVLGGLAGTAFMGKSSQLAAAGATVTSLMEQAREAAIMKRQPTALAMLAAGKESANRIFFVLAYEPEEQSVGSWKRVSRWEILPQGIVADSSVDSGGNALKAFFPANSPLSQPSLPEVTYNGQKYSAREEYGYVIFLPDGSLYQDISGSLSGGCVLRLVEGVFDEGSGIQYTGRQEAESGPANYFEIALNLATGRAKITRP